MVLKKVLL